MKPMCSVAGYIKIIALNVLDTHFQRWSQCHRFFLLLYLFICLSTRATTLVTIVGPGPHIFMGADSLFSYQGGGQDFHCKIHHEGVVVFASSGLFYKPETNFRVEVLARASCQRMNGDVAKIADDFLLHALKPLRKSLKYSRLHTHGYYEAHYVGKPVLEIAFGSVMATNPQVALVSFRTDSAGKLSYPITHIPNALKSDAAFSGEHIEIDSTWQSIRRNHPDNGGFIRELIHVEEIAHPDKVGGPISIVDIGPDDRQWLSVGYCGDQP